MREAARGRATFIAAAEADHQEAKIVRPEERGGYGLDAILNDDFHHSARVALTGHNESYYANYLGTAQELLSAVKWGFLYQGQRARRMKAARGTPALDLRPSEFVTFLENHDQVSNSVDGRRLYALADPGRYRALTALLLLNAGTPLLFQGQEFASSRPFLYFADHHADLAAMVARGRAEELCRFPSIATRAMRDRLLAPHDPETFQISKLDLSERERHAEAYALHRDLIQLRRWDPVLKHRKHGGVDGAVLGSDAFVLRFFGGEAGDRVLLVNLGRDLELDPARPEPLLAPPEGTPWRLAWSCDYPLSGGRGSPPRHGDDGWCLPGHAAVLLTPAA